MKKGEGVAKGTGIARAKRTVPGDGVIRGEGAEVGALKCITIDVLVAILEMRERSVGH